MKLLPMWCSAKSEVICICEGNAVAATTVSMAVMASELSLLQNPWNCFRFSTSPNETP